MILDMFIVMLKHTSGFSVILKPHKLFSRSLKSNQVLWKAPDTHGASLGQAMEAEKVRRWAGVKASSI